MSADKEPRVSIVIPTLDAGDMLLSCLEDLDAGRFEVIVVDNASTDGSVDRALARFPHLRIVGNDTNRGYAPACNIGARQARGRYLLFLNDDASVAPETIDRLVATADQEPTTAVWQPVTLGPDGTLESAGDLFTWWGILRHLDAVPTKASTTEVFSTVGAALLVRRSVFEALGGFEASYFAYYEESDLCWRTRLAGWDVRVVAGAHVTHIGSATTGRIFPPHEVRYLAFRNRLRTILANASAGSLARIGIQHTLACLAFVVLYTVTGRLRSAGAVIAAMSWVAGHADVVREQRRRVQATRRRSDAQVFRRDLVASFGPRTVARHLRRAYWFERAADRAGDVSRSSRRT